MKALKKVIIIVLTAVMLVTALSVPAAAATRTGSSALSVTAYDVKLQIAEAVAASANAAIERLVAIAQSQTDPNIELLVYQTNAISAIAIIIINALGYDAVCEYVTYEIGGQLVEIDPIIVIPTGGGTGS